MKILFVFLVKLTLGLRIDDLNFPSHVMLGQSVTLNCEYSLNPNDEIDSIKWYKDNREFYRVIQNQNYLSGDRVSTFKRPGVKLNMQQSRLTKNGQHRLVLQDVDLNTTGEYRCQITLSGPPFHTAQSDRQLTVIIRPEGDPQIHGLRPSYNSEESIEVTCTSKRSFPAANLQFLINDEPASEEDVVRYPIELDKKSLGIVGPNQDDKLQTSIIRLTYSLSPRSRQRTTYEVDDGVIRNDLLSGGVVGGAGRGGLYERLRATGDVTLRLKCTAQIGSGYWKSTEAETRLRHRERLLESRSASPSNGVPFAFLIKMFTFMSLAHVATSLQDQYIRC